MSAAVLQRMAQIDDARARMLARGISCLDMEVGRRSLWQRIRGNPPTRLGDALKSWDVLRTVEYLDSTCSRDARVLDIGAYSSEILPVLCRAGYRRLEGIDLNPGLRGMPFAETIHYTVGDFLAAPFANASFDVVTAISVIEHGFDGPRLLAEIARLLAPGGSFVASVDYWPDKIDTNGTEFFGLDWRIFSQREVEDLVELARGYDLEPVGPLDLRAAERPIRCAGREYTFIWVALRRR